ncbi:MAG TPA: tetratricopeptide repeat protein [Spirochaetota bacterium]|nr:tetratricopeptide repeat protein [Spirochaetota bacterium]HPS87326.1 tetratricopeptide repeat protein [Spirochaetota bacterium]
MKKALLCSTMFFLFLTALYAQGAEDYVSLYQSNEYQKSYEIIISKLNGIYSKRVEDKRIPAGYIALSNVGEDVNLLTLFRNRKEKGFFIEDNSELSELHFYAGRCSVKLNKNKEGLNHYVQSLRFRKIEPARDDVIFYEIAQIFKSYNEPSFFKGYIDALEQAYTFNPSKYQYSYEIGDALSSTKEKKKAIFHLRRYIENTEEVVKPEVYLKLGNLYESIEKYLETEKYYNEYLRLRPDDAETLFSLGYISYFRTGNYILAESSLQRALKILKKEDIYRRSKSHEYLGDMSYNNLKYDKALSFYYECINYQEKILEMIAAKNDERKSVNVKINKLKSALINDKEFEKYEDYEILIDERNKLDKEIENFQLEFNKLQPGRVRWFIAVSNEKIEKYEEAIKYYREAVKFDYNSNNAREMIVKLQLKIKRGY